MRAVLTRVKSASVAVDGKTIGQIGQGFLILLGIWILADFTGFWTTFHQLFFTNDLWLLNPATDLMINLFPEAFFSHLVIRILLWFLAFYLPCLIVAFYNRRQSIQMFFFPQSVGRRQKR